MTHTLPQRNALQIRRKMAEDPVWQKPNVIFSGHEVPGEGEHKIMEYIRCVRVCLCPPIAVGLWCVDGGSW